MFIVSELRPRAAAPCWLALALTVACARSEPDVVRRGGDEGSDSSASAAAPPVGAARSAVLFVGTSLTAGLGLQGVERPFPSLVQDRIDAAGLPFRVVNAGVSGDTSAGGLRRLAPLLDDSVSVVLLELGANDGLRGLDVAELRTNLQAAIDLIRSRAPDAAIVLTGMRAPTNLGERYTSAFRDVFGELAADNQVPLVPFLLEGVAGDPTLNQEDRIHPTAAGHERIAATVWNVLEPILTERAAARMAPP